MSSNFACRREYRAVFLNDKNHFIPDGMVVCGREKIKPNWVEGAPGLVWEVLSPKTAKNDRRHKKNACEAGGVPEYWIVDPAALGGPLTAILKTAV